MLSDEDRRELSRRGFLRRAGLTGGLLLTPGLVAACGGDEGAGGDATTGASTASGPLGSMTSDQVVWADYGGTTREARKQAYFDSFTQETGVEVLMADAAPPLVDDMAAGGPAKWDLLPINAFDVVYFAQKDGLVEAPAPVRDQDLPAEIQPYAVCNYALSTVQCHLPDTFGGRSPRSWADFWDVDAFPGKRAWPGQGFYENTAEVALLADGVAPEDMYPLDFERAARKLDELRPHMFFYSSYPQVQQLLHTKTAALGIAPNGLFAGLAKQGVPNTVVWQEAILQDSLAAVPVQSEHVDAAFGLAQWFTDAGRQAEFSRLTNYGPSNEAAFEQLTDEELANLPNSPEHAKIAFVRDALAVAEQKADYVAYYNEWISS